MSVPSGTYQTFTAVGQREDLTDVIYNISPTETPILSSLARTKATAVYHEWQTDTLAAATRTAGQAASRLGSLRRLPLHHIDHLLPRCDDLLGPRDLLPDDRLASVCRRDRDRIPPHIQPPVD